MTSWGVFAGFVTTTTLFLLTSGNNNKYGEDPLSYGLGTGLFVFLWKKVGDLICYADHVRSWMVPIRVLMFTLFTSFLFTVYVIDTLKEYIFENGLTTDKLLAGEIAYISFYYLNRYL